ncbi:uracil-DNA glycosylase [Curtobacterium sp. ISL-83]|uniref:uracil-DNA glycosylase n=1 Tax=Curtobacterium sp. ISL-83 TaxID=2819145 RepID=UPI001BE7F8B4|nr:uracil-DNA glycosylase [Curtobacterium sp. ISL-83]MBT2503684.1 uracil-DNA glycosylase [Curtobacterium sp. ISL-83]
MPKPLADLVDPGWASALAPVESEVHRMGAWLRDEVAAGRHYLPAGDVVLRAFTQPFEAVRVLVIGQDPYPTPGHPIGLSFAVDPEVRPVPRSLANIYRELASDLGITPPVHGDLRTWSDRGVLLLNRVLTVEAGAAGSHRGKGWEAVTDQAVRALVARGTPLVAVLWGAQAASVRPLLGDTPVVASAHPSPLSASRGFFGSRPFSQVNELLVAQGAEPVDWNLPAEASRASRP